MASKKKRTAEPLRRALAARAAAFPIAGIGASAGGFEAFAEMLSALPSDAGMAFVLIQYLDPTHESMLAPLLARKSPLPVSQVTDGLAVEPNHVYVIPPNSKMGIRNGLLELTDRAASGEKNMPIDHFFQSLAAYCGESAVGVILSGTATDGTLGLKAIKSEGGVCFAQDEASAKYPGMPASAIAAGWVDFVLPPRKIAIEVTRIARHQRQGPLDSAGAVLPTANDNWTPNSRAECTAAALGTGKRRADSPCHRRYHGAGTDDGRPAANSGATQRPHGGADHRSGRRAAQNLAGIA
jgi:chemotaxis response regulator CheB